MIHRYIDRQIDRQMQVEEEEEMVQMKSAAMFIESSQ